MSVMVVVLLLGLWALILLPGAWRDRRYASPLKAVDAFEQSMSRLSTPGSAPGGHVVVLGGSPRPGAPGQPAPRPAARPVAPRPGAASRTRQPSPRTLQRRRQVLAVLAAATAVTGLAGLLAGGVAWVAFLAAYAALFGYLALLAQLRARRDQARVNLAYLTPAPARPQLSSGVRIRAARGA